MKSSEVRKKYISFYERNGHASIPSARLVPENDPTTLFTSSGMQPLIPYLLGQRHPSGKRLVDSQKSFRSQDIEEVGDNRHTTFFEMLGNWSLGDYFKHEQLPWIFTFLTNEIGLDPKRLYVTAFAGNESVQQDTESIEIWKTLFADVGITANLGERIFTYPAKKNWWSRSGEPDRMPAGEPGGPDSEVFYDFGIAHDKAFGEVCHPNCDCGRFMEIANSVFMQYQKQADGTLKELSQKNVDFGGGLERMVAATNDNPDVFMTDLFRSIIQTIEVISIKKYGQDTESTKAMRIVADHVKAAVMMMTDGVLPSNKTQGYVLRRLIRRALLYSRPLGLSGKWDFVTQLVMPVAEIYAQAYPDVLAKSSETAMLLKEEALRFGKTLEKGLKELQKIDHLDGASAFTLYETYGFPWEMTEELTRAKGLDIDHEEFEKAFRNHQKLSRSAAAGMFKGGLADHSEQTTKLHTATHLLHEALHRILGSHIQQKGSNITSERLRFDFSHPTKLSDEQLKQITRVVNEKIQENLSVSHRVMDKETALTSGARAFFGERYGEQVSVYTIGDYSKEICGGPHVLQTGTLGTFTIVKEESAGAGIRRIYATVS